MAPLLALLLLVSALCAEGQHSPPTYDDETPYGANFNPSMAILIIVLVSAFFFLGFFSVYIRRCSGDRSAISPAVIAAAAAASRRGVHRGLDPAVIETFPTLAYSAVRGLKIGKEALECAVCLCEFSEDETLRMLPKCCHVFHPDCIDTWLASHVTCPVCRSNLAVPADSESEKEEEIQPAEDDVAINIEGDRSEEDNRRARIGRSRSVGVDRFTLRLPEHVRREIVAAGNLRRSASIAAFPAGGEGSSRKGFRSFRLGRSDRWAEFLVRTFSARRRGEGEGSVKKGEVAAEGSAKGGIFPSVKAPLNCLGGGGGGKSDSGDDDAECSTAPLAHV